jgi:hypothetical protein
MMRSVIDGVSDAGWAAPTPCEQWNAAQVLRHAAGDQLAYAAAITGSGGPAENPFEPSAGRPEDPADYLEAALLRRGCLVDGGAGYRRPADPAAAGRDGR